MIYWARQTIGIVLAPLHGFLGLALVRALSAGFTIVQGIYEAEYWGTWELTKEGFLSGAACFLVMWIIVLLNEEFCICLMK